MGQTSEPREQHGGRGERRKMKIDSKNFRVPHGKKSKLKERPTIVDSTCKPKELYLGTMTVESSNDVSASR